MQIEEYTLYSNYSANLKLATIVLALLTSISSLSLSLNVSPILLTFNKYAFAQQNPVYQIIKEITELTNHLKWPIVETIRLQTRYNLHPLLITTPLLQLSCITQANLIAQV